MKGVEWVDITVKAPLWRTIPPEYRLTEDAIRRRYSPPSRWADWLAPKVIARLNHPECEVAVRATEFGSGLWMPCGMQTGGHDRCKRHGGPGLHPRAESRVSQAVRIRELEAEVERLRSGTG